MMAGIKGKDTKPELIVRRGLHRIGLRYVLHDKRLPGRPDLVFPKFRAVVFVNGCFWHGHCCRSFRWPKTRPEFWREKINSNKARDTQTKLKLAAAGWRQMTIWECELKGKDCDRAMSVVAGCAKWLIGNN